MLALTRTLFPSATGLRSLSTRISRYAYSTGPALTEGEQNILNKLSERFSPRELKVQDISGGCGTFYAIEISSEVFKGLPIVKQHRLVTDTIKKEIEGIHGLQIKTAVPS
ncbi:hypothetical protein AX16_000138 [Volvariella volvacea WC 439]|nr:hypothetical protein AX16_000138 [Volvariella volvacea WC 439]